MIVEVKGQNGARIGDFLLCLVKFLLVVRAISNSEPKHGVNPFQATSCEVGPLVHLSLGIRSSSQQPSSIRSRTRNEIKNCGGFEDGTVWSVQRGDLAIRILFEKLGGLVRLSEFKSRNEFDFYASKLACNDGLGDVGVWGCGVNGELSCCSNFTGHNTRFEFSQKLLNGRPIVKKFVPNNFI